MDKKLFTTEELSELEQLYVTGGKAIAPDSIMAQPQCINDEPGCGAGVDQSGCTNSANFCGGTVLQTGC